MWTVEANIDAMRDRDPTEYSYRAVDPEGHEVSGTIMASASSDAACQLIDQGLLPTSFRAGTLRQAAVEPPFLGPTHTPYLKLLNSPDSPTLRFVTNYKFALVMLTMALLFLGGICAMWLLGDPKEDPQIYVIAAIMALASLIMLALTTVRKRIVVDGPNREVVVEWHTGAHVWSQSRRTPVRVVHTLKCIGVCEAPGSMKLRPVARLIFSDGSAMDFDTAQSMEGVREMAGHLSRCLNLPLEDYFRSGRLVPVQFDGDHRTEA